MITLTEPGVPTPFQRLAELYRDNERLLAQLGRNKRKRGIAAIALDRAFAEHESIMVQLRRNRAEANRILGGFDGEGRD